MEEEQNLNLSSEIKKLKNELNEKEKTFSEKRAQFKELYMKKEEKLKLLNDDYNSAIQDGIRWKEETDKLIKEIEDVRSASLLTESLRMDELEQMRVKYHDDLARMEKGLMDVVASSSNTEVDKEFPSKGDNVLARIAQRVKANTQEVMKVWKEEDVSVKALPQEEDVQLLKDKIRDAYKRIDDLEKELLCGEIIDVVSLTEKVSQPSTPLQLTKTASQTVARGSETRGFPDNRLAKLQGSMDDEVTMKKSRSGDDLRSCDSNCEALSMRRNTDVQSLNEFHTDDFVNDNNICVSKNRTVSENEWSRLHLELSALKNRSSGICELCKNYEDQLQSLQDKFKTQLKEYSELSEENQLNLRLIFSIRETNNKLTCQLNDTAAGHEKTIIDLSVKYNNLNDFCDRLRVAYERFRESTDRELKNIFNERRDVKMKMEKIECSYEHLLGVRGKKASEMEAETIDLPTDIETAQFRLLTLNEEFIQMKSANEHLNEKIQSLEIFDKEKERADNAEKEAILVEYNNDKKELESKAEHLNIELNKLKVAQKTSDNLEETLHILKTELDTVKKNYTNLEKENHSIKKKSYALQEELENSESVQQDFVRLSQTLQIQLEKIRQEEKELRWQFQDDVKVCNDCQLDFHATNNRNKHNCRHCGKIFCRSCLSEIPSGASARKADVCKVCHTMLVKDAVPYFSIKKL